LEQIRVLYSCQSSHCADRGSYRHHVQALQRALHLKTTALPSCPEKEGYIARSDTDWVRTAQTQESQTAPANAQQICSLDQNCVAWNSFGYYILVKSPTAPTVAAAGVSFTPYDKLCTYVKASALQAQPSTTKPAAGGGTFAITNHVLAVRNMANNLCFAANDAQRLLLGIHRVALVPCSARDATQGFKFVPSGNAFTITDSKGRCVTTYSVFVRTAAVMRCNGGRDQLWSIASQSPDGKGPYYIKSQESGQCIMKMRNSLGLGTCIRNNPNAAFQLAAV
jgi:hypothetical protein